MVLDALRDKLKASCEHVLEKFWDLEDFDNVSKLSGVIGDTSTELSKVRDNFNGVKACLNGVDAGTLQDMIDQVIVSWDSVLICT